MEQNEQPLHPETLAIRAGRETSQFGEHSQSLFLTSSFCFDNAEEGAALFIGEKEGYTYARFTNPTVTAFERRLAAMEGGERAIATASGMAAIQGVMMTLLKAGDHIVASKNMFGSTISLFSGTLTRFGIEVTFVPLNDEQAWRDAIRPNTRLLFLETPSNPLGDLADIAAMARLAHAHNALLVVDNCFCTPALQRPLSLGADLVVHSATKGLDGHGRVMGGAVVGKDELIEQIYLHVRTAGPTLAPFNAWVLLSGLETLHIRQERQSQNAQALAEWLEQHPAVERVYYPGLPSHPQHELARRQQSSGGTVVSFVLKAGRQAAWQAVDRVQVISRTANVGDVKSTITHPATTTHSRVPPEVKAEVGITDGLVRLSVGLEHIDDLKNDLQQALA